MLAQQPASTFFVARTRIKAMGDMGVIGGYLVCFGLPRDSQGEYFTQDTEFRLDWYKTERPVLYHHGVGASESEPIGHVTNMRKDAHGLYCEAQLDMTHPMARKVLQQIKAGRIGWSSGSMPHLVKTENDGRITTWPLVEASLTPSPAAGKRTTVQAIKMTLDDMGIEPKAKDPSTAPKILAKGKRTQPKSKEQLGAKAMNTALLIAAMEKAGSTSDQILATLKELPIDAAEETAEPGEMGMAMDTSTDDPAAAAMNDQVPVKVAEPVKTEQPPVSMAQIKAMMQEAIRDLVPQAKTSNIGAITQSRQAPRQGRYRTPYSDMPLDDTIFLGQVMNAANTARAMRGEADTWKNKSAFFRELANKAHSEFNKGNFELSPESEMAVKAAIAGKSDEANYSTQAAFGDEFVPTLWNSQLWKKPRLPNTVVGNIPVIEMPSDPYEYPIEYTDPTVYAIGEFKNASQAQVHDETNTLIGSSKVGTGKKTLTSGELALRVMPSKRLEEDSIIPLIAQWRAQSVRAMENARDNVLLNAHYQTGTTNINYYGASITSTGSQIHKALYGGGNGIMTLPLVTNTAAAVSMGGADPTLLKLRELRTKLDRNIMADYGNLVYFTDPLTYQRMLGIDELLNFQVNGQSSTVNNGQIPMIDGIPVFVSNEIAASNTAGVVSSTAGNNLYGRVLLFHKPSWVMGYRRDVTVYFDFHPEYLAWQLIVAMRMALINRADDTAAVLYYCKN